VVTSPLSIDHYLTLPWRGPGGLVSARPVSQQRSWIEQPLATDYERLPCLRASLLSVAAQPRTEPAQRDGLADAVVSTACFERDPDRMPSGGFSG
jgi:hypothetical protein